MAKLSSSINLIDNMSKVLNRITGNTDKMKKSIDNTQKQMNQETNFVKNLSRDEQVLRLISSQYKSQQQEVQRLTGMYQKEAEVVRQLDDIYRKHSDTTSAGAFMAKKEMEDRAKTLDKYKNELEKAQLKEIKLASSVDKASKALEQQHNAMKKNIQSSSGLIGKVKGLVGVYLGFTGAKKLLKSTIGQAGELTRQAGVIQAAFGNADVGKNYFNQLQLYAIETRQDMDALTDVTRNFMQITKNTNHLKGFTNAANKLSLRTGNIGSAESLMQEAMRGEFSRLQRVLHLTDAQIAPLKKAIGKGSLEGIIKGFDDAMNTAGLTDAIVDAYQNSPMEKMKKAMEKFKLGMGMAGEEALARLEPLFDRINGWLESSNADAFFGAIAFGITMVVEAVTWLTDVIVGNWDLILPILLAVATVFIPQLIMQLWATIPPLLMQLSIWIGLNYPILVVIGTIAIFIAMLMQSGITAEQVTGSIGAVFAGLYAFLYNVIAGLWNGFAMLAEFFANVWNHPVYSTKALFANMATNILDMAISMSEGFDSTATTLANAFVSGANIAIGAVNGLISALNKVPGIDIGTVGKVDKIGSVTGGLKKAKANVANWLGDAPAGYWKAPTMDMKNIGEYATKGYNAGAALPGKFSTGLDSIKNSIGDFAGQEDAWNNLQNNGLNNGLGDLGKKGKDLNKTGKDIKKSVDKSSEDLKYLRDLAEKEVINRFTTAEIKVEQHNQNNINNEMDLDGVINHLSVGVEEAMEIAAEGVH